MTDYRPFDQEEKLGEPPWRPSDPAVRAWEEAHGHDLRLKCYPEFRCRVIESDAYERGRAAERDRIVAMLREYGVHTAAARYIESERNHE